MTSKEIIKANLEHTPTTRPGFHFDGSRLSDFFFSGVGRPLTYSDERWVEDNMEYYYDDWGNLWRRIIGRSRKGEIHRPVLENWNNLDDYEMPDFSNPELYTRMRKDFSQDSDRYKIASIGGWIFDNARYLRRLDMYLLDMCLNPDKIKMINEMVAKTYEIKINMAAECGADGIMIGEDLGTQTGSLFSPAMYREFFKPIYRDLTDLAHEKGMHVLIHSCGNNWDLIDDMIDAGFDAFQFDQPEVYDLDLLAEKFKKHKKTLYSPIDIQKVLPTGNYDLIRKSAKAMIEKFNGFLIVKNYGDLHGIGVKPEWDNYGYECLLEYAGLK